MQADVTRDDNGIQFRINNDGSAEYQTAWDIVKEQQIREAMSGISLPATKPAGNFAGIRWNTCCRQHRDALDAAGIAWKADGDDAGSQWRHISDDVPARGAMCLIYSDNTDSNFDYFVAKWDGVWVTEGGILFAGPMLPYWMPLPEPPTCP